MSIRARPFQQATINAAMKTLVNTNGARRFLVADEVGLGKTVVASGVIQKLIKSRNRDDGPICVLYVCSNLSIARQNMGRLVSFLPEDQRHQAIARHVDRPSLLPMVPAHQLPSHPDIHLYSLTPATAIPTRKGQRQSGRKEERALALVMLFRLMPNLRSRRRLYDTFRCSAGKETFSNWIHHFRRLEREGALGGASFRNDFRNALLETLGMQPRQQLPPRIMALLDDDENKSDLIGAARSALAIAALRSLSPDLVILDEFQRFKDITEPARSHGESEGLDDGSRLRDRAAVIVLNQITGNAGIDGPALLLLSATPYTPYQGHSNTENANSGVADHDTGFFELVSFLSGKSSTAETAKKHFRELGIELRKGDINSVEAKAIRTRLENVLAPLMSRTERPRLSGDAQASIDEAIVVDAKLQPEDMSEFLKMQACFKSDDIPWVVPLWQSVPLPMQTLGSRYQAWRRKEKAPATVCLSKIGRNAYHEPRVWPHPQFRALLSSLSEQSLQLPWMTPSLPWWPMQGGWKSTGKNMAPHGKLLVFSRYRAVPTALAGLISYTAESRLLSKSVRHKNSSYVGASDRRCLNASAGLIQLFYPSVFLASLEPLSSLGQSLPEIRLQLRHQLRNRLRALGVILLHEKMPRFSQSWKLLAAIEKKAGFLESTLDSWQKIAVLDNALARSIEIWSAKAQQLDCSYLTEGDIANLAEMALNLPGVVLLRALGRHWSSAFKPENRLCITNTLWHGLRTYLDKPWFVAALCGKAQSKYPAALRKAVVDGNLESVLDEHFWYLSTDGSGDWPSRLADFSAGLGLRNVNVTFHESSNGSQRAEEMAALSLRCHVAVPLTEGRSQAADISSTGQIPENDRPLRPDEVRQAFNSPFWPNVLITTSVGQEGIDLHPWCDSLAHWDLASSPVSLEQREGRVTRFAGLAIRRAIASSYGRSDDGELGSHSPWVKMASYAERELRDDTGLSPWWYLPEARCRRLLFAVPGGEQRRRYEALAKERALYRLVLGMPDQSDLMSLLSVTTSSTDPDSIREACLDLSAYNRDKNK